MAQIPRAWLADERGFNSEFGVALGDFIETLRALGPEAGEHFDELMAVDEEAAVLWVLKQGQKSGLLVDEPSVTAAPVAASTCTCQPARVPLLTLVPK